MRTVRGPRDRPAPRLRVRHVHLGGGRLARLRGALPRARRQDARVQAGAAARGDGARHRALAALRRRRFEALLRRSRAVARLRLWRPTRLLAVTRAARAVASSFAAAVHWYARDCLCYGNGIQLLGTDSCSSFAKRTDSIASCHEDCSWHPRDRLCSPLAPSVPSAQRHACGIRVCQLAPRLYYARYSPHSRPRLSRVLISLALSDSRALALDE